MAAVERQPFGEVSTGRLQQLSSAKNRQNGLFLPKDTLTSTTCLPTPTKRTYAMSNLNDDSENLDPSLSLASSKKNKFELLHTPSKPLTNLPSATQHVPTYTEPRTRPSESRLELSPSKAPMGAPAGRSPKRRTIGLAKPKRSFMPYTRIDPPFTSRSGSALPFSLDAALNSSLNSSKAALLSKPLPSKWKFDIYEDTPEEESATLMEHSTLTLDLSSDDEGGQQKKLDRGKENTPPEGYDASTASSRNIASAASAHIEIVRRKLETDEMDDGQRSPLSDLDVEPFSTIEAGESSYIVVEPETQDEPSKSAASSVEDFTLNLAVPPSSVEPAISVEDKVPVGEPVSNDSIVVFEDQPAVEMAVVSIATHASNGTPA